MAPWSNRSCTLRSTRFGQHFGLRAAHASAGLALESLDGLREHENQIVHGLGIPRPRDLVTLSRHDQLCPQPAADDNGSGMA